MFSYTIKKGGQNFFDVKKVRSATLRGQIKGMMQAGAYCRRVAVNSMKNAGKLPKANLVQLALAAGLDPKGMPREAIAELLRQNEVGLHAPPGQPPFAHSGLIKKHITYDFEPGAFQVIVGPGKLPSKTGNALPALEHGGTVGHTILKRPIFMKARPFMHPAMVKTLTKYPKMFADTVKE